MYADMYAASFHIIEERVCVCVFFTSFRRCCFSFSLLCLLNGERDFYFGANIWVSKRLVQSARKLCLDLSNLHPGTKKYIVSRVFLDFLDLFNWLLCAVGYLIKIVQKAFGETKKEKLVKKYC
jgi:hypothetical protein